MEIILNGEPRELPDGCTAAGLIEILGIGDRKVAMEVNREIIPRSLYAEHRLAPGDRVEVVHAIGGG